MTKAGESGAFDPGKVKAYVERIESIKDEIASVKAKNAKECQDLGKDITDILDEAKSNGVPKKELKANIKRRDLEQKLEAIREDLEEDEQETYDQIRHALGDLADTPLGRSLFDADDDDRDLRPRFVGTSDEAPEEKPKRGRKAKAAPEPAVTSPEEEAALGEIEAAGSIGGAAASFEVH